MVNLFNHINRIKYRDLGCFFKVRRKKTQTFYSQADRKRLTLPSYGQLFMIFCLILDYDYMGQFLRGGKNGRLMSFFFKSRASV